MAKRLLHLVHTSREPAVLPSNGSADIPWICNLSWWVKYGQITHITAKLAFGWSRSSFIAPFPTQVSMKTLQHSLLQRHVSCTSSYQTWLSLCWRDRGTSYQCNNTSNDESSPAFLSWYLRSVLDRCLINIIFILRNFSLAYILLW